MPTLSPISIKEIGRVKAVKKAIVKVGGLSNFMNGQLVEFSGGTKGLVVGFSEEEVLVLILGDESTVRIGQEVYSKEEEFRIPVGGEFIGRIVNPFGQPLDGKGTIAVSELAGEPVYGFDPHTRTPAHPHTEYYPVFREAPGTMDRAGADLPLETGTKIIDAIIPISKGQCELIIGDRMTGKTTICVDAILNQKNKEVICIYCCIGKSFSSLLRVAQIFKANGAFDYTMIVSATASAVVGEQYLAPYSACALGEYFMYKGKDVLIIFDDMTKHAWSYRQLSLLLERPPGREAYPGDIYYIHSQLIERAGKLSKELGGGSMTSLPIVDTLQGDVTGFIPSNLISMTDGQIYLNSGLFAEGFKPAVDLTTSVSIIGTRTQNPILKDLSKNICLEYAQYVELLRLTRLKSGLTARAEQKIRHGEVIRILLAQDRNKPVAVGDLIVLLYALNKKVLDILSEDQIIRFKDGIRTYIINNMPGLAEGLESARELTDEIAGQLDKALVKYFEGE